MGGASAGAVRAGFAVGAACSASWPSIALGAASATAAATSSGSPKRPSGNSAAFVHNVELQLGRGGQLCRSAGTYAQVMAKEGGYVLLRMPSGELRNVWGKNRGTIGQVGNLDHENVVLGKAGRSRWLGVRPANRGVAMNPVDHPHGGGEGKAKGGHPVTPWGIPTKGYRTRRTKKASTRFIVKRRNSK